MSAKTIAAYQRLTGKVPPMSERLRDQAGQLRRRAAALLAQSNDLESMAAELDPPALVSPEPTCDCNTALSFYNTQLDGGALGIKCYCDRCRGRCDFVPGVTFVYGYGRDKATALADWRRRMDSF